MRLKITFRAVPKFKIPYNSNYTIATIIYNALDDQDYATELHDDRGFKYFTFSQVQIPKLQIDSDGLISKDGRFHVFVSSASEEFIRNLWHGLFKDPYVDFHGAKVEVEKTEILEKPSFNESMEFRTLSPIVIRTIKNGKTWDLPAAAPQFWMQLKDNLLKKYKQFHRNYDGNEDIIVDLNEKTVKQKRVIIKKGDLEIYHRAYQMRFEMSADLRLLEFAYDAGLGEKTGMGFGMINIT